MLWISAERNCLHLHAAPAEAKYDLKKTKNRVLLSVSGLGPSYDGDLKKTKI